MTDIIEGCDHITTPRRSCLDTPGGQQKLAAMRALEEKLDNPSSQSTPIVGGSSKRYPGKGVHLQANRKWRAVFIHQRITYRGEMHDTEDEAAHDHDRLVRVNNLDRGLIFPTMNFEMEDVL